eukprot:Tbor_TRINITY_DN5796_c2_g1::TRINITY_DN5796_c2_g1_i3::g.20399::m.20399
MPSDSLLSTSSDISPFAAPRSQDSNPVAAHNSCVCSRSSNTAHSSDCVELIFSNTVIARQRDEKGVYCDRKARHEKLRTERMTGRLIDITLAEIAHKRSAISPLNMSLYDYRFEKNSINVVSASFSQFTPIKFFPPTAHDCCQTFSTIAAVIIGSLEFVTTMENIWIPSTIHYILYISAWIHHITKPLWSRNGSLRPTTRDLGDILRFSTFFPVSPSDDFSVIFYNESVKAREMVFQLCMPSGEIKEDTALSASGTKRQRTELEFHSLANNSNHCCGYTIVSGDYTISIVCLKHHKKSKYTRQVYSLILCDSHGSLPWANDKASFTCVNVEDSADCSRHSSNQQRIFSLETGVTHFCNILFALLEDNRKDWFKTRPQINENRCKTGKTTVPYMTWTPFFRKCCGAGLAAVELRDTIQKKWLPSILNKSACSLSSLKGMSLDKVKFNLGKN